MPGETKAQFFARVTAALADRGKPVDLPADVETARVVSAGPDVLALFIERVDASGMQAHRVADEAAAVDKVAVLIAELGAERAVVPEAPFAGRDTIVARLTEAGVTLLDVNDADASFEADVGVTGVEAAVAETGSLVVCSGNGHRRLASLAPPAHIAIVGRDQIVPDLIDWAARAPAEPPANLVLISGPSKTADIEMTLVAGVHGPGTVHVIVIE